MALVTSMVMCDKSNDSLLSVSVRRVHVVFSTAGFKDGGKPCPKARETAAVRIIISSYQLSHVTYLYFVYSCVSYYVILTADIFLDATSKRGGFTCLRTRPSSARKSSSREYGMFPTH